MKFAYIYICIHTYIYIYISIHTYIYTHIYIYIYMYVDIHISGIFIIRKCMYFDFVLQFYFLTNTLFSKENSNGK